MPNSMRLIKISSRRANKLGVAKKFWAKRLGDSDCLDMCEVFYYL